MLAAKEGLKWILGWEGKEEKQRDEPNIDALKKWLGSQQTWALRAQETLLVKPKSRLF